MAVPVGRGPVGPCVAAMPERRRGKAVPSAQSHGACTERCARATQRSARHRDGHTACAGLHSSMSARHAEQKGKFLISVSRSANTGSAARLHSSSARCISSTSSRAGGLMEHHPTAAAGPAGPGSISCPRPASGLATRAWILGNLMASEGWKETEGRRGLGKGPFTFAADAI